MVEWSAKINDECQGAESQAEKALNAGEGRTIDLQMGAGSTRMHRRPSHLPFTYCQSYRAHLHRVGSNGPAADQQQDVLEPAHANGIQSSLKAILACSLGIQVFALFSIELTLTIRAMGGYRRHQQGCLHTVSFFLRLPRHGGG